MILRKKRCCFWLVGAVALAMAGCASTSAERRMQPLPGMAAQADQKDHGYGGDDGSDGWLVDRLMGKKPGTTAPLYENSAQNGQGAPGTPGVQGVQGMTPNANGIQQVSAIGPSIGAGQPYRASEIPASSTSQVEGGLAGEALEKPKPWWDPTQLSPTEISDSFKATFGLDPNEDRAQALYKQGSDYYRQKYYSAAAKRFKRAAARWPDSLLEEDALFFQGESHFFADEYTKAQDAYGNLLKKHGNTRYLDTTSRRLYAIGKYWEKAWAANPHWATTPNMTDKSKPFFDTWGNAIKAYEMVAMYDPTGPLADESLMTMANAYFHRQRYLDAAEYYDRIRTDYPKSKYILDAHLLSMKSHEESYQGAQYDDTPLKKADKVAEALLTQFGNQLGENRENVVQTKSRIRAKMSEQDWAMAQFYEGKGQYASARCYYDVIIREYPNTPIAKSSQERLVAISDKPAKTVSPLQSVINVLDPKDDPLAQINQPKREEEQIAEKQAPFGFVKEWFSSKDDPYETAKQNEGSTLR